MSRFEAIWQTPLAAGLRLQMGCLDNNGEDVEWGGVDELKWVCDRSDEIIEEAKRGRKS